jgi:hypothetical protein
MYPRFVEAVIECKRSVRLLLAKHYEENNSFPSNWRQLNEGEEEQ